VGALSAGQTLSHYRILRPLGAGGMGEVYLAEDSKLGRQVALKVLAHESARDPDRRARFEREARAVAALNHPNIVTIHSVEEADGLLFLTMELVEGKTLSECIAPGGMTLAELLRLAIPLADAVGTAHQRGITHRDLKPANVMVADDGRVKVLDFGLAKQQPKDAFQGETAMLPAENLTADGRILGTVAYMSPEQAQGKAVDSRSDIFSLGIVLFEMATAARPFTGDSNVSVLSAILKDTPPLVTDLRADLPRELARIVRRCMEKDPEERYQSAKDLRNDLKALKADSDSGEPTRTASTIVAPAVSAPANAPPETARRRSRVWVWGVAAIVAVTGSAIAWWRSPPPRPRISATRQITTDGVQKIGQPVTDGTRLYFTVAMFEGREFVVVQVSVSGGETVLLAHDSPALLDIDPSGTELLVGTEGDLSIMPIVGGPKRRVGDVRTSTFPFGGATWTPDKSRIIYSSGTQLRIVNGDGTNSRPLLTTRGLPYAPRMSPDGTRLRYSVRDDSTGGSSSTLWEANYDGSNAHPLLPGWTGAPQACCGKWTPDGRYYLFEAQGNIWAIAERRGVFDRRPVDPVQLTVGPLYFTGVTPSRDSKTLFAVGNLAKGRLVRFDGKTRQFVSYLGGLSAEGVVVSPDKQWVAYTAYPEGTLWRSRLDGNERMALTSAPTRAALPQWSPDGTQIAYVGWAGSASSDKASTAQIYVGRAAGGEPRRVTQGPASHGDPCWLSDGKRIVFGTEARIDVMDVAAGTVETLPGSQHYFSPRCSPDGRYIAAVSVESDRLVIFDTRSGARTDLVQSVPGGLTWPNWSPDSQALSYFQGTVIRRVHIADRRVEMIVDARDMDVAIGALGQWTGVDPDGSPMFLLNAGTHDIYALDWEAP
jgi:serine/threonine protein kinase/Tol biopolymer transport system component